jgi:hypothetical protein
MMLATSNLWERICCFLADLSSDYGNPDDSFADTVTLGANFTLLTTSPRKCVVVIRNTGTVNVEIALSQNALVGCILQPGDPLTIYNFRGSLYGRGDTGTVNFFRVGRW